MRGGECQRQRDVDGEAWVWGPVVQVSDLNSSPGSLRDLNKHYFALILSCDNRTVPLLQTYSYTSKSFHHKMKNKLVTPIIYFLTSTE